MIGFKIDRDPARLRRVAKRNRDWAAEARALPGKRTNPKVFERMIAAKLRLADDLEAEADDIEAGRR